MERGKVITAPYLAPSVLSVPPFASRPVFPLFSPSRIEGGVASSVRRPYFYSSQLKWRLAVQGPASGERPEGREGGFS